MDPIATLLSVILAVILAWLTWLTKSLGAISRESHDLHRWHSPDELGRQNWKNPDIVELLNEARGLREEVRELSRTIKEWRVFSSGPSSGPTRGKHGN